MQPRNPIVLWGAASLAVVGFAAFAMGQTAIPGIKTTTESPARKDKIVMSDAGWKARLTPEQYDIIRQAGTERPYSSPMNKIHVPGTFVSAATGQPLFRTADKFDSGTGWPSFVKPIDPDAVWYRVDRSLGMARIEVLSSRDDGHLGHLFNDGPANRGGLRYCMNGDALKFVPDKPGTKR